jgi:hypothetical protein
VLDAGRIAELVRRRFKVEYTLAGLDLLLHQAPAAGDSRDVLAGRLVR